MQQNRATKTPRLAQANRTIVQKAAAADGEQPHCIDKRNHQSRPNVSQVQSAAQAQAIPKAEPKKLASRGELYLAIALLVSVAALFVAGRAMYDERYYTPEEGLGYWLGLSGGVMMMLAMMYTAFKYVNKLRSSAAMKYWLTLHIVLGIAGLVLVLVHSTFRIGSLNGGVALVSMLLVYVSGIVGRLIYSKTHCGLGGTQARAKNLQERLKVAGYKIKSSRLDRFAASVLTHKRSLVHALWEQLCFGWRSSWVYFRVNETMRLQLLKLAAQQGWDRATVRQKHREFKGQLRDYIETLRKVALFRLYERFFLFLRNAHMPLIYLLLMSGVAHVIAVHMY